jgi:hypothetical protein
VGRTRHKTHNHRLGGPNYPGRPFYFQNPMRFKMMFQRFRLRFAETEAELAMLLLAGLQDAHFAPGGNDKAAGPFLDFLFSEQLLDSPDQVSSF